MNNIGRGNPLLSNSMSFKPNIKVDVYDRYQEVTQGDTVKIAEVLSDGEHGQLNVLKPEFKKQLMSMFTQPLSVMKEGAVGPDGITVDAAPEQMAPWKPETLQQVVQYKLPVHNFRGEISSMGVSVEM